MDTNYRLTSPVLHYGILFLIFGTALLTLLSHSLFHGSHSFDHGMMMTSMQPISAAENTKCISAGKLYQVVIANDHATPQTTTAKLCDRITFTNRDNVVREIAFGPHEQHIPYDGVAAKTLSRNQSFTITLNKAGSYHFHDHFHDEAAGFFNVSK